MNCKDCEFIKCRLRTKEEFEKCPVDVKKEKYEELQKNEK